MIDIAISFSENAKQIVDRYNSRERVEKVSSYWEDEEISNLKKEIKTYYKEKQNFTCSYCNQRIRVDHSSIWDIEHIASKKNYPEFMFEPRNLCIACKDCNGFKSQKEVFTRNDIRRYPRSSSAFKIIHPHFDNYEDHIIIIGGIYYSPRNEKGCFTMSCCNLYRFAGGDLGYDNNLAKNPELLQVIDDLMKREVTEASEIKINVCEEGKPQLQYIVKAEKE